VTPDADPGNPLWSPLRENAERISGLLGECSQLVDQLADAQFRNALGRAVRELEYLNGRLLSQPARVTPRQTDKELLERIRADTTVIAELLKESERIANELGDSEARRLMFSAQNMLSQLEMAIEGK